MKEDFPFRQYAAADLLEEFAALRSLDNRELKKRKTGYKCSNAFFQFERFNTPTFGHKSCIEYWATHRATALNYHRRSPAQDLQGVVQFLNHAPAQFPPNVAMWFYEYFGARAVFDPFAGWGDRALAAMALDIDYVGADTNKALAAPYAEMLGFYPHAGRVRFINKPAEKINLNKLNFDLIFSSPPFFSKGNLIEHYADMSVTNYDEFNARVLIPLIAAGRARGVPVCFYITDEMAHDIGVDYQMVVSFNARGNKKSQTYNFYCY